MKSRAKRGMLMNPSVTWLVPLGLPAYIDPAAGENVSSLSFSPLSYIYLYINVYFQFILIYLSLFSKELMRGLIYISTLILFIYIFIYFI